MNRIKRVKNEQFVTMSNVIFWDKGLSLKAKGLYATVMGLPDSWNFTVAGLAKITKESRDAIASGIDELTTSGYVVKERVKDAQGRFTGMNYTFFEVARIADYPTSDNPTSENAAQVSIISIVNKESSNEDSSYQEKHTHNTHAGARGDEVSEASGESDGEDDLQVGDNALNADAEEVLSLSPSSERSEGLGEESPGAAGGEAAADRGEYADLFPYPFDQLYHAFEEYFDNQIGLCRITPAQIAFLEPETPLKDLEAWKETIDTYRGNFNAELGRYLPDKFATVIQVFKMHHSRLMRERRETGVTNGQKHILSITDREKEDAAYKAQNKLTAPPKSE